MQEIEEMLQKISNEFNTLLTEKSDLEDEIEDLEGEIADLKSDDSLHPLVDYINELEKDFYFRSQSCKDNLTVEKIVYDLVTLAKEIKE